VDDIAAYIKKAEAAGAKVCVPTQEVPGMGHFAWLTDPEGNTFGMWKPMKR
jgi:predicted enzyme related to lactoylglutathione lyase